MSDIPAFIVDDAKNERIAIASEAVRVAFKSLSILADSLIEEAKKQTKTREEYIAYMKGAAFLFYRVCQRNDLPHATKSTGISSIEDAIHHCWDLYPFMTDLEKGEHFKLISWLNELLEFKGKNKIEPPEEYMNDEDIKKSIQAYNNSGYE